MSKYLQISVTSKEKKNYTHVCPPPHTVTGNQNKVSKSCFQQHPFCDCPSACSWRQALHGKTKSWYFTLTVIKTKRIISNPGNRKLWPPVRLWPINLLPCYSLPFYTPLPSKQWQNGLLSQNGMTPERQFFFQEVKRSPKLCFLALWVDVFPSSFPHSSKLHNSAEDTVRP